MADLQNLLILLDNPLIGVVINGAIAPITGNFAPWLKAIAFQSR